ncbi:MAG: cupredoxin domain-containing protein [Actinomycetota bacterium]
MKSRALFALIVIVLAVVGTACSSSGGGASDSIDVKLESFKFEGTSWEVPAGEEITITMENVSTIDHEWVILKPGVTIASEDDLPETEEELLADFVYWEEEVLAGDSQTFTFTAPPAGEYQVICAIEGHFAAGMEGSLTASDSDV